MRLGLPRTRRHWGGVLMALTLGASGTAVVPAHAAAAVDPPASVQIEVVTAKGSGCKKDTVEVGVSPDREAFTVLYSEYLAQAGGDTANRESKKTCRLEIRLSIPAGFTWAIAKADYRGFASLQGGARAVERAKYRFQGGGPDRAFAEHPFAGPYEDDWHTTDTEAALLFGPCGKKRELRIDTELQVSVGTSDPATTSFIVMDSTDGEISTKFHLAWKTCR